MLVRKRGLRVLIWLINAHMISRSSTERNKNGWKESQTVRFSVFLCQESVVSVLRGDKMKSERKNGNEGDDNSKDEKRGKTW